MKSFIDGKFVFDNQTVVIGHSLGCLLGMRLAEKYMFHTLVLVAGWDFNDLTPQHQSFWEDPIDHETIKAHINEIHCFSSDNDPYFTKITVEEMAGRLGGSFHLIPGAGHFTDEYGVAQLPDVLEAIES